MHSQKRESVVWACFLWTLLVLILSSGCQPPTQPDPLPPSPTPTPAPCVLGRLAIVAEVDGQATIAWPPGVVPIVRARPLDPLGQALACDLPLIATWAPPQGTASCVLLGDHYALERPLKCTSGGYVDVVVSVTRAGQVIIGATTFRVMG